MASQLTIRQFFKRFPGEDSCLERIMDVRYGLRHTCGACGVVDATFHKITGRRAYACAHCGDHLYPCADTIFADSRTPLQLWFYALYLFVATRHGVSAKELERQLGVTYKTAWRMGHQIRQLMTKADPGGLMGGSLRHVEMDEAYVGGRQSGGKRGRGTTNKTVVFGLKERGGQFRGVVVPDASMATLRKVVLGNVKPGTIVSTDEFGGYNLLVRDGYIHNTVKHAEKQYAKVDELSNNVHVNSVESFWRLFKASVRGTHVQISKKHANRYVNEFAFRQNFRAMENGMFDLLLASL
ncbi:MAG: IS1595 family transposase [Proteobacteria bacterium]|nr:IS1595 family transposase [Pseudomonadota bacterium]